MVSACDCLFVSLQCGGVFPGVERFFLPCIHDTCVSEEGPESKWGREVFRFFMSRGRGGRGGRGVCRKGRLCAGVGGEGLTFAVEDGLFVVRITKDVKVRTNQVPESRFLPEGNGVNIQCFPNFGGFPCGEVFNDSVVFLAGAILQKGYPDAALGEACRFEFPALGVVVLDGGVVHRRG